MEIRNNCAETMDHSDGGTTQTDLLQDAPRPPTSPCESDISVGCENDRSERIPSPMDMTAEMSSEDEEGEVQSPRSTSLSREVPSPHTMSPASVQGSETFSYLSEDEYFRPLKRLAMSDTSSPPAHGQERNAAVFSSPERPQNPLKSHKQPKSRHSDGEQKPQHRGSCSSVENEDSDKSVADVSVRLEGHPEDLDLDHEDENPGDEAPEAMVRGDQKGSGLRSFSILDILSYKPSRRKSSVPVKIVRPWDTKEDSTTTDNSSTVRPRATEQSNTNNNSSKRASGQNGDKGSALDALFKMTNKTLDNLNKEDKSDAVNLFNNRQPAKKKRKSRTAFTNHQIFELEKRFLYQKYLSPADRDELAQNLGLSNAQVITWFQNRRAKLKRDMEELKRDVESSKIINNKAFLEASANVVAFLKSKDLPKIQIAALPH